MEKKTARVQIVMPPSELERLDSWRIARGIWSRSEAIRRALFQMTASEYPPVIVKPIPRKAAS